MAELVNDEITILVVDDEPGIRDSLQSWLQEDGYTVEVAADGKEALTLLDKHPVDIVLLDIRLPGMDGMELLQRMRSVSQDLIIIMITAFASVDTAVEALKNGAFDYLTKPFDPDDLNRLIHTAVQRRFLQLENRRLKEGIDRLSSLDELIGSSPAMGKVRTLVKSLARADAHLLIQGERGTGKELVARLIHSNSARRYFPLITLSCSDLGDDMVEGVLLGREPAPSEGRHRRHRGKVELASGGTLLLDEVGNLSLSVQRVLSELLSTGRYVRPGGAREVEADLRIICTSSTDLGQDLAQGSFSQDLYDLLAVLKLDLPPLRDREGDIPELVQHFLTRFQQAMGKQVTSITPEALQALQEYDWPRNVRELRNTIERAVVICPEDCIDVEHLVLGGVTPALSSAAPVGEPGAPGPPAPVETLAELEKGHITRVLELHDRDLAETARVLGIDQATLSEKIREHGLEE